ncbi:MAG: efflux RND transporter periplasmic adaptor subunit [Desulfobacterium sp.]|nr:efflux RND transporter periplasmic adaptor subunit [Desulfobacterium sp.]
MEIKTNIRPIIITAVITALVTAGIGMAWFLLMGYHTPHLITVPASDSGGVAVTKQLYTCGMHPWIITEEPGLCPICNMELTPKRDVDLAPSGEPGERQVVYWRAPMDPTEIYEAPGKSRMGMDLVPVYEDELVGGVEIKVDPVTVHNMGIRTTRVEETDLVHTIRTYGHITYDETSMVKVSPKVAGWYDKLHVNFTGDVVEKGQPLYDIYSPDLLAAQEEYLSALGSPSRNLLESARSRLSFFDLADTEILGIKAAGRAKRTLTIRSPADGVVIEKNAVAGGFVNAGTTAYTIVDLSRVWVEAHIYEYEMEMIEKGLDAEMTLPYHPGKVCKGKVTFIYPYMERGTRDLVIRLEFENPDLTLKPDMFAEVFIRTKGKGPGLTIPSESVIRSGTRNIVFVAKGNGRFAPRETTLGIPVDGGRVHVITGLAPGETVVTSGQFLLDSESRLKEAVRKMMDPEVPSPEEEKEAEDDFFGDMENES